MGQCMCKEERPHHSHHPHSDEEDYRPSTTHPSPRVIEVSSTVNRERSFPSHVIPASEASSLRRIMPYVDNLVLETLAIIRTLVVSDQETPYCMLRLQAVSSKGHGWLLVLHSMVNIIPMTDPLGPAVITLLLDDYPLPAKDSITKLSRMFWLSGKASKRGKSDPTRHRNICIALGCIAEKLAGPTAVALLTEGTLEYLIANLDESNHPYVVLFSIIALEKFAQTSENKMAILRRLNQEPHNPLKTLELWISSEDYVKRQVGFCSEWCLDNLFLSDSRPFSYERTNNSDVNVMLNANDVSEYLKISANGLEARSDASSFESVRCTFQVDIGIWYYEALIITPGIMQIGWATKNSKFLNHEGYGIGDDEYSLAYDGCRNLIWYEANCTPHGMSTWKPGDVLGCLLDLSSLEAIFTLNGVALPSCSQLFSKTQSGFFAAASFMSFQQCAFNFGSTAFRFPPTDRAFRSFNDVAFLDPEQKVILPRPKKLEQLRQLSVREDSCTLCCDTVASVTLQPCGHKGFCLPCSHQLDLCPMCRGLISDRHALPLSPS